MKKILATSLLITFFLTGCNTMEGFGQDVAKVGHEITDAANK